MNKLLAVVAAVVAIAGGAYAFWTGRTAAEIEMQTAPVERAAIRRVISTTGKIHPLLTVEISSQLSGQIAEVSADFNSRVTKGQVIARIDPRTYEARLREAQAGLAVAKAGVALQEAALARAEATLRKAQRDHQRTLALQGRGAVSESALDAAVAAFDSAKADLEVAKAQVVNARAAQNQRQAVLDSAAVDLERTWLRSPIDGIVIDRSVEIGQTVAASFQAPKLFTIAENLERIRIEAQVDEAEIGNVAIGNLATFTVDTFPDTTFSGRVGQIRLSPTDQQNVVTYTVIIEAANPGGRLLPGMTANVAIVTGERERVLVVPHEALRFQPRGAALQRVREAETPQPRDGGQLIERLNAELGLSPEQAEQVRQILRAQFAAARDGNGEERGPALRGRLPGLLRDVLSPDQLRRLEASQLERPVRFGTVWILAADGALTQRRVRLGLEDDRVVEVLSGLADAETVVLRAREKSK